MRPLTPSLVSLYLVGLLACQSAERGADRSDEGSSGQNAGFTLDVLSTRDCDPGPNARLAQDEYVLGVQVRLRASADQVPQNYYYATLSDGEGTSRQAVFAGCEPRLSGPPLARGQEASGYINFELPRRARGLKLAYAPRVGDTEAARGPAVTRELGR